MGWIDSWEHRRSVTGSTPVMVIQVRFLAGAPNYHLKTINTPTTRRIKMEFINLINSVISSITPEQWTIGGIASFLTMSAFRGLFMFTFIIKIPEAVENTKLVRPLKEVLLAGFEVLERVGIVYDVAFNTVVATILFFDRPGGLHTFSFRMGKYLAEDDGWRNKVAQQVCKILSHIDEGHCTKIYLNGF